jgi:hypothetical protein
MKSIICEMPFNIVEICGPLQTNKPVFDDKSVRQEILPGEVLITPYDSFQQIFFETIADDRIKKMSKATRRNLLSFFSETVPRYIEAIAIKDIILIERTIDSYYGQVESCRPAVYSVTGSQTRSINNHAGLAAALTERFGNNFENVSLERASIYYQYKLFSSAKIIIAQHGGALANVFFMHQTSHVIEISPPYNRDKYYFRNLAIFSGVKYHSILQEGDHSDISIDEVLHSVEEIYSSFAP